MNEKEFILLIDEHKSLIFKVCNLYCSAAERPDLQQEILLQLWQSMDKYDGRVKISTWIYKISLNTAVSHYRKTSKKQKNRAILNPSILINDSDYDFEKDQNIKRLYSYIQELKVMDRALILLYLDQYKYEEIANIIGISRTNVATKLSRIKEHLRIRFKDVK
ncbi:MAG: sigma-70 family RNA polymerase sigma factor [Saprospiraceae bacterium]|nr:sigma-70 family RNA polymerase sigma factor [Saprospiraceae bacterium]